MRPNIPSELLVWTIRTFGVSFGERNAAHHSLPNVFQVRQNFSRPPDNLKPVKELKFHSGIRLDSVRRRRLIKLILLALNIVNLRHKTAPLTLLQSPRFRRQLMVME